MAQTLNLVLHTQILNLTSMKRLILLAMLGIASSLAPTAKAQVSINVNIGSQPRWAPVYYEEVAYQPVVTRYYTPVRTHYRPAPVHYSSPRHYTRHRTNKVKYINHYNAPRHHKYKGRGHGKKQHSYYKQGKRDRGIERITRPRG